MEIEKIIAGKELNIPKAGSLKNQKVNRKKSGVRGSTITLATIAGLVTFALGVALYSNIKDGIEFRQAYNQALKQYGDTNGDKLVSHEEEKELFNRIFYKKGITFSSVGYYNRLYPLYARYSNGREVPIIELTGIVKDYIDNPLGIK